MQTPNQSVAADAGVDPRLRELESLFVEGRAINADLRGERGIMYDSGSYSGVIPGVLG